MTSASLLLLLIGYIFTGWNSTLVKCQDVQHPSGAHADADPVLQTLLANNAGWAANVERAQPGFFNESAKAQHPKVLWLGCSDSRVPESVITAAMPGEMFVHRNIAGQVPPDDPSALAVIAYAVEHLKIDRIIVAGHTHCGGVAYCHEHASSLPTPAPSPAPPLPEVVLDAWLGPLYSKAIELIPSNQGKSKEEALAHLTEENVRMQVERVAGMEVIRKAWEHGRDVAVYGWLYEIEHGRLRDLRICAGRPGTATESICRA